MDTDRLKLVVIVASVREARFGPVAAAWAAEQALRHGGFDVEVLDLADVPLPLVLGPEPPAMATSDPRPPELAEAARPLETADAFVIVTPEYNHSFPASIKALIDWHYREWRAKPVGFVSYGGSGGGIRAVEHLRLVLAELHATTVRDAVSFPSYWTTFGPDGQPSDEAEAEEASAAMLAQLHWWGDALRTARRELPMPVPA